MSLDGFIAGRNQTLEEPLGAGGEQLHEWAVAAQAWREAHGKEGGEMQLHVAPLRLGDGVRLLDGALPGAPRVLECTRVIESPTGVTHLRYRGRELSAVLLEGKNAVI